MPSNNDIVLKNKEIDALRAQIERLRAQNAQLLAAANAALIFIEACAADKIDDEYNRLVVKPLKAAITAAESEGE